MAEAQPDIDIDDVEPPEIWIPPSHGMKKTKIEDVYDDLIAFLNQDDYDEDLRKELEVALSEDIPVGSCFTSSERKPIYLEVIEWRKEDLKRMECGITITGDTSSGKTSLVNKIVGQTLVTPRVLRTTSKICRIRNSETYAVEVLDRHGKVLKEKTTFNEPKKLNKTLDKYKNKRENNDEMHYIDIFCPFSNLDVEGNVMLVDTPGIDGAKEMNSMLIDFLPNAFGFIFVIDVSRAGGVEEDRLVAILRTIVQARFKMPCFEPDDVLFVANKWNTLPFRASSKSDDSSEDEDMSISEEGKVWNTIVQKIEEVWPTFTKNQIYRVNLLNENPDNDTEEERNQFNRFAEVLSRLLEKTKNKKVKMHMSLLWDTISVIERGIESRIYTATSDNEDMVSALEDAQASLKQLNRRCEVIAGELNDDIKRSVENLSSQLYGYLRSHQGKHEILNPDGEKPISNCFFVVREVSRRFEKGVARWIKGKDVVDDIERIDSTALEKFKEVQLELEKVQVNITGKEIEKSTKMDTSFAAMLTIALNPLSLSFMLDNTRNMEIDRCYFTCVKLFTENQLQTIIFNIFKEHFEQRIRSIFEIELPKRILNITCIISHLSTERENIANNLEAILHLRDSLCKIKDGIDNLYL